MTPLGKLLKDAIDRRSINETVRDQLRFGAMKVRLNGVPVDSEEEARRYDSYIDSDNRLIETISELIN
jgi:hypothetical protein